MLKNHPDRNGNNAVSNGEKSNDNINHLVIEEGEEVPDERHFKQREGNREKSLPQDARVAAVEERQDGARRGRSPANRPEASWRCGFAISAARA